MENIVITGVGLIAPNANNISELTQFLRGSSFHFHKTIFDDQYEFSVGRTALDTVDHPILKTAFKKGTRAGHIARYCAKEAMISSGLDLSVFQLAQEKMGIYVGISDFGSDTTEKELRNYYNKNKRLELWSPYFNPNTVLNSPSGEISLQYGLTGPAYTLGGACAAGNLGIIQGMQMLQLGIVDFALAGGVSSSGHALNTLAGFHAQGALSLSAVVRPLDENRDGLVVSEGGALFLLEKKSKALERGATIYAEIAGYAVNSDGKNAVAPCKNAQVKCMHQALKMARLNPYDIDLVNLHATGTILGDLVEMDAVEDVFKGHASLAINASKGHLGHTMGASGALEIAGNLQSFHDSIIHPVLNLETIDPKIKMHESIVKKTLSKDIKYLLKNSFGMMGINTTIILKK